jgi:ABC-type transport system involved in multi-copper enzyme maturation permease subunit
MNSLIRTEWLKIRKYRAFWWLTAITALSYPGINYIFYNVYDDLIHKSNTAGKLAKFYIGNPFTFPEVWHTVAYFSSWFIFIPSVLVIMFITNEYTFKTHRQNIIDGWSRNQFMAAKMIDVLITSLLITLLYFIVSFVTGILNTDKGGSNSWGLFYYAGLFALQTFSQLSIAFLIGFLVRKAFISLGIFLFYFMILEPILVGLAKFKANDIGRFLPLEISDRLVPVPAFLGRLDGEAYEKSLAAINTHVWLTIIITTVVWVVCYWMNKRRDL